MGELKKAKPFESIILGGKERRLVFNLWSRACMQEEKGNNFFAKVDWTNISYFEIISFLWACLLDQHPEFDSGHVDLRRKKLKLVAKLFADLSEEDQGKVQVAVLNAVANYFADLGNKGEAEGEKKPQETSEPKNPENSPT